MALSHHSVNVHVAEVPPKGQYTKKMCTSPDLEKS